MRPLSYLLLCLTGTCFTMKAPAQNALTVEQNDSIGVARLLSNGTQKSHGKITAWFPKDSLSNKAMDSLVRMYAKGLAHLEQLVGAPLPWQAQEKTTLHHLCEAGQFHRPFCRQRQCPHTLLAGEKRAVALAARTGSYPAPQQKPRVSLSGLARSRKTPAQCNVAARGHGRLPLPAGLQTCRAGAV